MESMKPVLCPRHNLPMRRLKIVWGLIERPIGAEVIYGGCCIQLDSKGKEFRFGYVCSHCEKELEHNPDKQISCRYVLEDGRPIPLE